MIDPISSIPFLWELEGEAIATETPKPQFAQDRPVRLIGTAMPAIVR